MGGVFSLIEDNHIHHINNMMELGGAEIAGIKMHAAIDVTMRRNWIHHCTMGIWCDWEAQGTRISQNLLHDNQRPAFAKQLKGGMMSQDLFVEVGHGPTLIDNNILLSDATLRFATQGVAMVHNLICGAFTCVGGGIGPRYTPVPYPAPHRGHGVHDRPCTATTRFYNNIFVQKWPAEPFVTLHDSDDGKDEENREVGTHVWNGYPTYEEWIAMFDMDTDTPDMAKLDPAHNHALPVWCRGNVYFNGAKAWEHETDCLVDAEHPVSVEVTVGEDDRPRLETNLYDVLGDFPVPAWSTATCWAGRSNRSSASRTPMAHASSSTVITSVRTAAWPWSPVRWRVLGRSDNRCVDHSRSHYLGVSRLTPAYFAGSGK